MADMYLNTMDAAFNELQNTAVSTTVNKTIKTQEDQDAQTILTFLNNLDKKRSAAKVDKNIQNWGRYI